MYTSTLVRMGVPAGALVLRAQCPQDEGPYVWVNTLLLDNNIPYVVPVVEATHMAAITDCLKRSLDIAVELEAQYTRPVRLVVISTALTFGPVEGSILTGMGPVIADLVVHAEGQIIEPTFVFLGFNAAYMELTRVASLSVTKSSGMVTTMKWVRTWEEALKAFPHPTE